MKLQYILKCVDVILVPASELTKSLANAQTHSMLYCLRSFIQNILLFRLIGSN